MKQYYVRVENGIITQAFPLEQGKKLPEVIAKRFTLISIHENTRIYPRYSTYINGVFTENKDKYETEKAERDFKRKALKELQEIKDWFHSTDWMVNKIVIGEWSIDDERWLKYLEERAIKRARQDEINNNLS